MQPDIVYQSPQTAATKNKNFPSIKNLRIVVPLVLIVLLIAFLAVTFESNFFKAATPKPAPKNQKVTMGDARKSLVKDIQNSFSSSKDAGVLAYVNLAASEKDAARSYQYYVDAFKKMSASYQQSGGKPASVEEAKVRLGQKITMMELKAYASTLPGYKESDFTLPK